MAKTSFGSQVRYVHWFVALSLCAGRASGQTEVKVAPKYAAAVQQLEAFIQREVANKGLPALSIALVDDQKVVWTKGFGYANPEKKTTATAETVYRVGSVSKLFTDIAIMQLVEQGKLDLDAPIGRYLPAFKPANPYDVPITMRQMMSHRSGMVREPPVGNYFDPNNPSLAAMVESLNQTALVYKPESRLKYSNAAIATVGYVLESLQKEPFARYVQRAVLDPLGMKRSAFEPRADLTKDLAVATMWTYHGREFMAPTFELGMIPAGSMYSTVNDLAKFLCVLHAGGRSAHGPIVQPATLAKMLEPQFAKLDDKFAFGIGFYLTEFGGRRRIGHGGAVYGFATELAYLPVDKLGVVVVTSKDCANAVASRIADTALSLMIAVRQDKPLPAIEETQPLNPEQAKRLAGRYRWNERSFDLMEYDGKIMAVPARGGFLGEVRALKEGYLVDDVLSHGLKLTPVGNDLRIGADLYVKTPVKKPGSLKEKWHGLIGEYGWDHNILFILEKDEKLHALIEWFCLYPLEELAENVFAFPDYGLYHGEKLIFRRGADGRATSVEAAKVVFDRRHVDGEDGKTFRIRPQRPIDELRREAVAAQPPAERGEFRPAELVDLAALDPTIQLDIRYATDNNFLGVPLYTKAKAFMQRPAAQALVRVHQKLAEQGYGLLVHDAYRPWHVTKIFWEATPPHQRLFVANPAEGSRHNRGCAVDLTLFERSTGKAVEMVSGYDEFSDRAYARYWGGTSPQRWHRELLRRSMEAEGFRVYDAEWWHFDYRDWKQYAILNRTFEELEKK